ncbi:MAG TPA: NAD-dependent epimerase/dehydratase family protein [Stellaceae bacterium]
MAVVVVTGSAGLVGAEAVRFMAGQGFDVVGIDNDMRRAFFGDAASTAWSRQRLEADIKRYRHVDGDIRDAELIASVFARHGKAIAAIIHTAAQPSHDWAATNPSMDFTINADGTLNLLEAARNHCPEAVFIYTSTNKVYGDTPNSLPLTEHATRWEVRDGHPSAAHGIDESMSVDTTLHSLFGVSKLAADLLVQEYGRYFGLRTACFRCGCLTGPGHSGAMLHGFLAYLVKCAVGGDPYTVFGYKGKQVRDNLHAADLVGAFWQFMQRPKAGAVYNMGGGRHANCSMLEAISACEALSGRPMNWSYSEENRTGDHIWWISDVRRFQADFPGWRYRHDMASILEELHASLASRLSRG